MLQGLSGKRTRLAVTNSSKRPVTDAKATAGFSKSSRLALGAPALRREVPRLLSVSREAGHVREGSNALEGIFFESEVFVCAPCRAVASRRRKIVNPGFQTPVPLALPRFAFTKAMQICCPIMYALARWRSRGRICGRRAEPLGSERDRLAWRAAGAALPSQYEDSELPSTSVNLHQPCELRHMPVPYPPSFPLQSIFGNGVCL